MLKNRLKINLIIIAIILFSCSCVYAMFSITKTVNITVNSVPSNSKTLQTTITMDTDTYIVKEADDKTDIVAKIAYKNNDNIDNITYYYAWSTNAAEPTTYLEIDGQDISTENTYECTETVGIGSYYLWSKVVYTDEFGASKTITKQSDVINVVIRKYNNNIRR